MVVKQKRGPGRPKQVADAFSKALEACRFHQEQFEKNLNLVQEQETIRAKAFNTILGSSLVDLNLPTKKSEKKVETKAEAESTAPAKKRGRPKGSKNKPKTATVVPTEAPVTEPAPAVEPTKEAEVEQVTSAIAVPVNIPQSVVTDPALPEVKAEASTDAPALSRPTEPKRKLKV